MTADLRPSFTQAAEGSAPQRDATSKPFSIRLSSSQRKALEEAAGSLPLGTYVRQRLLDAAPTRGARRRSSTDAAALGRILGLIGKSGLWTGLADLGTAARSGTIVLTPEIEAEISTACKGIREIRRLLLVALGRQTEAGR